MTKTKKPRYRYWVEVDGKRVSNAWPRSTVREYTHAVVCRNKNHGGAFIQNLCGSEKLAKRKLAEEKLFWDSQELLILPVHSEEVES